MALKPNYNQQRAERNRAKQEKKDRKQRELQERKTSRTATGENDETQTTDDGAGSLIESMRPTSAPTTDGDGHGPQETKDK